MSRATAISFINSKFFSRITASMVIYSKDRLICDCAEELTQVGRRNTPTWSPLVAIHILKSDVVVSSILYSYCFDAVSIKCPIKNSMAEVIQNIKSLLICGVAVFRYYFHFSNSLAERFSHFIFHVVRLVIHGKSFSGGYNIQQQLHSI